jgi:hypothetical protein
MSDPLSTAEADEMSRAFDPTNTDALTTAAAAAAEEDAAADAAIEETESNGLGDGAGEAPGASTSAAAATTTAGTEAPAGEATPAPPPRRPATQNVVCPFCGIINETITLPCRQCGLENTSATRQATRSKIGPWFVWQARNPSAPGMNWATLMMLVEKGRVTARSVVRGPTTGQLWRYAARVKGLSRQFGLCWHCGAQVTRGAETRACPACKRMQLPPINPDVLLENAAGVDGPRFAPSIRPSGGIHGQAAAGRSRGMVGLVAPAQPVRREVPHPAGSDDDDDVDGSAPESPDIEPDIPVIDMNEVLPSGMEFRAFQLPGEEAAAGGAAGAGPQLQPQQQRRQPHPRRGTLARVAVAAVITFITLAAVLYLHPEVRAHYRKWWDGLRAWIKSPGSSRRAAADLDDPAGASASALDFVNAAPRVTPAAAQPPRRAVAFAPAPLLNMAEMPARPPPPASPATTSAVSLRTTTTQPTSRKLPEVTLSPGSAAPNIGQHSAAKPASAPSDASAEDAARVQISPPPSDPQTADRRAWELYERAIKSEQRGDYGAAVKEYQWIEQLRLPEGLGPLDVEARLARARKLLLERENASTTGHE